MIKNVLKKFRNTKEKQPETPKYQDYKALRQNPCQISQNAADPLKSNPIAVMNFHKRVKQLEYEIEKLKRKTELNQIKIQHIADNMPKETFDNDQFLRDNIHLLDDNIKNMIKLSLEKKTP